MGQPIDKIPLKRFKSIGDLEKFPLRSLNLLIGATASSVKAPRQFLRQRVLDGLRIFPPVRVTLDFDGSVLSTPRRAEGTAVGFNKKRKDARSD